MKIFNYTLLVLFVLLTSSSCKETVPRLSAIGEDNINSEGSFSAEKTNFEITTAEDSILVEGICDERFTDILVSFDNKGTWTSLEIVNSHVKTKQDCKNQSFSLYIDQIKNYFTYQSDIVGNQTKYIFLKGDLGFTESNPISVSISNTDFIAPAPPTLKTFSGTSLVRMFISGAGTEPDFSHYECNVDNGNWYTCQDQDDITLDGTTPPSAYYEGYLHVRSVDNFGNSSESVNKIFKKGIIGRGVDGSINQILEYAEGQYLIAGNFSYYESTFDGTNFITDTTKHSSYLLLVDDYGNVLKTWSNINGYINVIHKLDNKYYVGGDFTLFDNVSRNYLVRLNADLSIDTSFPNLFFDNEVKGIDSDTDGNLYIIGDFTELQDVYNIYYNRKNVVRLKANTFELNSNFANITSNINMTYGAHYLDTRDSNKSNHALYLGGDFSSVTATDSTGAVNHTTSGVVRIDININTGDINTSFVGLADDTTRVYGISSSFNQGEIALSLLNRTYSSNACGPCIINVVNGAYVSTVYNRSEFSKVFNNKMYINHLAYGIMEFDSTNTEINRSDITGQNDKDIIILNNGDIITVGSHNITSGNLRKSILRLNASDLSLNTEYFGDFR